MNENQDDNSKLQESNTVFADFDLIKPSLKRVISLNASPNDSLQKHWKGRLQC